MPTGAEQTGYDRGYEYAGQNPYGTEFDEDPAPDEFDEAASTAGFGTSGPERDDFDRGFRAGWREYMKVEFPE
ncbi:hypothetical protein [Mycobacterium intracellulare]|uniref:hypothetical protein n=1 Tax=Mycobacterium intracellulare TaxID=1767 RepID=UPI000B36060F|nr:hypothetical protein [Mycobacterium intracellulare]UCN12812.1 hypothetical protein LFT50_28215 [Mycobacterium intracellulare subsp. chimaera]